MTQILKKQVSAKTTAVVFGVLIIACLFAFYVSAQDWNEPIQPPPAGNVPAPINTGSEPQTRTGNLNINMIVDHGDTTGNITIDGRLEAQGDVVASRFVDRTDGRFFLNLSAMSNLGGPVGIAPTGSIDPSSPVLTVDSKGNLNFDTPTLKVVGDIDVFPDISTPGNLGVYRIGGVAGKNYTCTENKVLKDIVVQGGIITGGVCADYQTGGGGTLTGSGTATQVAFFTGPTVIGSDAGLYWDNTNKRLIIAKADGSNPVTLKVQNLQGTGSDSRIILGTSNNIGVDTVGAVLLADRTDVGGAGSTDLNFQTSFSTTMNTRLTIKADGKIGVGTASPAYTLDVVGVINTTSGYSKSGVPGITTAAACTSSEVLKGVKVQGGIITAGACAADETGTAAVPSGVIVMWSGSAANIPTGWALCNGANGTPDLRNKFIMGAGGSYNPGDTGGTTNHRHLYTTTSTAGQGYSPDWSIDSSPKIPQFSHQHSGTTGHADNLPPYYALAFIMKL